MFIILTGSLYFYHTKTVPKVTDIGPDLLELFESVSRERFLLLSRDACRAKRGIAIVSRPSVRPSVCNVDVPGAYRLD